MGGQIVITRMFEVLHECIVNEGEWAKKLLSSAKVEDGKVIIDATTNQLLRRTRLHQGVHWTPLFLF